MDACTINPQTALYAHLTWFAGGFRSFAWLFEDETGVEISGSKPIDPNTITETIAHFTTSEHIVLHVEGDVEQGVSAAVKLHKGAILLSAIMNDECNFDLLADESGTSQHLIEPPGVRSAHPIPARELWIVPTGEKHPLLTSMRAMQANSRRKSAHLEDVQRMAALHIEERKRQGCEPLQEGGRRPSARRGDRRTGRLNPNR